MRVNCPICDEVTEVTMVCKNTNSADFVPTFSFTCESCKSEFGTPQSTFVNQMIKKAFESNSESTESKAFPRSMC